MTQKKKTLCWSPWPGRCGCSCTLCKLGLAVPRTGHSTKMAKPGGAGQGRAMQCIAMQCEVILNTGGGENEQTERSPK